MEWPEVIELRDITITPLEAGNSKTKMALAADPQSPMLGHFRYGQPESVIRIENLSPSDVTAAHVVEDPVIYGGLLFRHFGHALSESIHRLWPRFALKHLNDTKIAFSLINNAKVMPYVTEALNLHGIPRRNIIRIERPMRFCRLFVGPQARQMAGPTLIPEYRTMLDDQLEKRLPAAGGNRRLYISRMHHHHTGSFYGESLVENLLADNGFEIIHPERHTLTELVIMLRSSGLAVFAEGSAIHALELCGSATPAVFVIGRRQGSVARFAPMLSNTCEKWMVSDHWLASRGMSEDPKKHSGVLNLFAVMDDLWLFADLTGRKKLERTAVLKAVERDLRHHIEDGRNYRTRDYALRAEQVKQTVISMASSAWKQI